MSFYLPATYSLSQKKKIPASGFQSEQRKLKCSYAPLIPFYTEIMI